MENTEKKLLIVTVSTDDISADFIKKFKAQLKEQLPNHDTAVICVGIEDRVDVTVIDKN